MLHSCPFILLSCPFMFRRCVSKIQVFENWYAKTILNRSGGYPPKRSCFFIFRYRFCYRLAIGLEARAGCNLQVSWTCACISSWSFFYSYRFLGRQCVGSVKLQAKLKWNAPGYYTVPFFCGRLHLWEQYVRRHFVTPNEWHFVEDQARGMLNPISCAFVRLNHNVWANKSNALWFMVQSTVFHG